MTEKPGPLWVSAGEKWDQRSQDVGKPSLHNLFIDFFFLDWKNNHMLFAKTIHKAAIQQNVLLIR